MTNLNELIKNNAVVVVNTETTGLCSDEDNSNKLYEISARKVVNGKITNALFLYRDDKLKIDNSSMAVQVYLFKTDGDEAIREFACEILQGFNFDAPLLFVGSDKVMLEASDIKSAVKKLKRFVGKKILCGYDLMSDLKFFNYYQAFDDIQTVDLFPIVKTMIGDKVQNLKLNTVCEYFGIDVNKKSAVTLTAELLLKLVDGTNDNV